MTPDHEHEQLPTLNSSRHTPPLHLELPTAAANDLIPLDEHTFQAGGTQESAEQSQDEESFQFKDEPIIIHRAAEDEYTDKIASSDACLEDIRGLNLMGRKHKRQYSGENTLIGDGHQLSASFDVTLPRKKFRKRKHKRSPSDTRSAPPLHQSLFRDHIQRRERQNKKELIREFEKVTDELGPCTF